MIYAFVSVAGIPLIVAVALVMIWRRLYREFPFFFGYLFVVLTAEIVRHVYLHKSYVEYSYAYWIAEAFIVCVAFLVLYEVFLIRLFPGFNITPIYRYLFPIAGLIVVALTAAMFLSAPSQGPSRLAVLVGEFTLALNFLQVSVLVFFSCLLLLMSRDWTRYDFGIAFGFGVHASVKLMTTIIRARHGYATTRFDQLPTIAYTIAALIWLFYLSAGTPPEKEVLLTPQMADEAKQLKGWLRSWFRN
jgi:hypothetical protein